MPRTNIPVQVIPSNGGVDNDITYTAADAANDHEFLNSGNEMLYMKSTTAGAKSATAVSVSDEHGRTGDTTMAPNGSEIIAVAGPFKPSVWNQRAAADAGKMFVDIASDAGVVFAVVQFTPAI